MTTVLITGASRGIGLEFAHQYVDNGDRVLATCRTPATAHELQSLGRASNGRLSVHAMDVGDLESVKAAAREIGGRSIDLLINNAGISGGVRTLEDTDFDGWMRAFRVNAIGPFQVVQTFLANLLKAEQAKIITISSRGASSVAPYGGAYGYGSSKAAVNRVMQALARDLKAQGIIVASVHPGFVMTDMGSESLAFMEQQGALNTLTVLSVEECVSCIRNVIEELTLEDTGKFYKWNGEVHPW